MMNDEWKNRFLGLLSLLLGFGFIAVFVLSLQPSETCREQVLREIKEDNAFRSALRASLDEAVADDFLVKLTPKKVADQ